MGGKLFKLTWIPLYMHKRVYVVLLEPHTFVGVALTPWVFSLLYLYAEKIWKAGTPRMRDMNMHEYVASYCIVHVYTPWFGGFRSR